MALRASAQSIGNARFEETSTTQLFPLGQACIDSEGGHWVYGQANGALTQYDCVKIDNDGQVVQMTTTVSGAEPTAAGVVQVAFADNEYGWVWRGGAGGGLNSGIKVRVLASCAADVKIYTTATAGCLDDTATDLVQGLCIIAANGGSTAAVECFASGLLMTNAQD